MTSLPNTSILFRAAILCIACISACTTQKALEPSASAKPTPPMEQEVQADSSSEKDKALVPPSTPAIEQTPPKKETRVETISETVTKAVTRPSGGVKGNIKLTDAGGKPVSAEGTLIELIPLTNIKKATASNVEHVVDTKSKTYMPGYLTVNVGDTLVFTNSDPIKHNVFSSSPNNTFDLGTYGFNRIEKYQVKHKGIIKVYCNIHREMALFISASNGNPAQVADINGQFSFPDIDAGQYKLTAWHPRGKTEKLIQISKDKDININLSIDTSHYTPEPRVNKHGKPYKEKPAIFEDEFY